MRVKKRASKRLGTKQREKVKKKVREHQRKTRKDAKNDVTWRTKKKQDPGIPNSFPYKEQLLNEIEQRRVEAEQQKLADKEARKNGTTVEAGGADDDEAADEDMDVAEASTSAAAEPIMFTGSLTSFVGGKDFEEKSLRLTLMLLDARDPLSWRVPQVEQSLLAPAAAPKGRKAKAKTAAKVDIAYVLTRADLIPRETLAAWMAHLSSAFDRPLFAVCSPVTSQHGRPARAAAGIDALATHIKSVVGDDQESAVAVLGIENAGRSSLAQALAAALPDVAVLDTPALLPASSFLSNEDDREDDQEEEEEESEEAIQQRDREATHRVLIRNAGSIFKIREPLPLIDAMMTRVAQVSDLLIAHNTYAFADTNDFLVGVARSAGRMKKGSIPDTTAGARTVLHQWSTGTLGYYAKPPPMTTEQEKERVTSCRKAIEADAALSLVSLPRKEWRQKWQNKELRLTTGSSDAGILGTGKIAFAQVASESDDEEMEEDEEDEDDDDVDEDGDDVDEDEDDA